MGKYECEEFGRSEYSVEKSGANPDYAGSRQFHERLVGDAYPVRPAAGNLSAKTAQPGFEQLIVDEISAKVQAAMTNLVTSIHTTRRLPPDLVSAFNENLQGASQPASIDKRLLRYLTDGPPGIDRLNFELMRRGSDLQVELQSQPSGRKILVLFQRESQLVKDTAGDVI